jgi:hypothetical protein
VALPLAVLYVEAPALAADERVTIRYGHRGRRKP